MPDFYIVPPRLMVGSFDRAAVVNSINTLKGDLTFTADPLTGVKLVTSGNNIQIGLIPNYFVKKAGDYVTGNIQFTPSGTNYGLQLFYNSSDPATGATGALYFNTTDNQLKIYDNTGWNVIQSTAGISASYANQFYLRLDASNDPMQGDLDMGTYFFRVGNKATQVIAGTQGQIYFNTDTKKIEVYNGTAWVPIGLGITSITASTGLTSTQNPITSVATLSVNTAANFTWTGTHTFNSPVIFAAAGQTFNISNLFISGQTQGDIITYNGANWSRYGIGTTGQVLTVNSSGTGVTWGVGSGSAIGLSTLNGLGVTSQDFAVGTSGSLFNIVSSGSTHTFNIPIAGTGATGLVSTQAQTFAGSKTFSSNTIISSSTSSTSTTTGALLVSGGIGISGNASIAQTILIFNPSNDYYVGIKAGTSTTSITYTLPTSGPSTGSSVLQSDTSGNLSWVGVTAGTASSSGFATTAQNINLSETSENNNFFLTFSKYSSGSGVALSAGVGLSFNPSTNTLSTSNILGTLQTANQPNITGLGTISTGTWAATAITARYGGTGYTNYTSGTILVGAGSTFIALTPGTQNYVLTSSNIFSSGIGWSYTSGAAITNTPPSPSNVSQFWWDDTDGSLSIYYDDGNGSPQWVEVVGGFASTGGGGSGTVNTGNQYEVPVYSTTGNALSGSASFLNVGTGLTVLYTADSISSSTGALVISGGVGIGKSVSVSGRLQLFNGANYTSFVSSASGNTTYTLPATSPATGTSVLQSTSSGVLSWVAMTATGGGGAAISTSPPSPASNGDFWWDSGSGTLKVYYVDPTSDAYWVDASGGSIYAKEKSTVLLAAGYTPAASGVDTVEIPVPYSSYDGTSVLTFNIRRLFTRVGTSGSGSTVRFEVYTGTGAFIGSTIGDVSLSASSYEAATTSGFAISTVQSGNKLRLNFKNLGTEQYFTCGVELAE